jgi:hypothetical protein
MERTWALELWAEAAKTDIDLLDWHENYFKTLEPDFPNI